MKNPEVFEKLCGILEKSVEKAVEELDRGGSERVSVQDAEYLDYLTHSIKCIATTLAMDGYGHSERRGRDSMGRYTSRDGGSYDGSYYDGSYRSYEGRSMHGDEMKEKLRRMSDETDDERVKRALREAMRSI
jgi:hypothetical protein